MALPDVTTQRLRLTRWDAARDLPALVALNARPEAVQFLNDGVPYTSAESLAQSARFSAHWEQQGFGLWAVSVVESGLTVGFTGLSHPLWFPELRHEVELGWRLHPDAWGQGYATEAGRAAVAGAADVLGLTRLIAVIDPANTRSIAVAERLGLHQERTVEHPQRPGLVAIYALELSS